jgi:hypothetical protein
LTAVTVVTQTCICGSEHGGCERDSINIMTHKDHT